MQEDIYITRDEFIAGQQWYWQAGDSDVWYYDSSVNQIKQLEGDLYADVTELGASAFNFTYPGEDTQSYPFEWLVQYNG